MTLGPLMVDVEGTSLTGEDRRVLAHPLVGAVILFTRNFESLEQLEALVREHGFRLVSAGVVERWARATLVEAVAAFER